MKHPGWQHPVRIGLRHLSRKMLRRTAKLMLFDFKYLFLGPLRGLFFVSRLMLTIDLYANGITNIHVYAMNKPDVVAAIKANLSDILGK